MYNKIITLACKSVFTQVMCQKLRDLLVYEHLMNYLSNGGTCFVNEYLF